MASDVVKNGYLDAISVALIGSCTNSSYEDMSRAADIAKQANRMGLKVKIPLQVTPGSEMIRGTIDRDGQVETLRSIGANVLANACGPCIGQWKIPELKKGEPNTIVTSYNRNFPGRNDGSRETMNFIGSPELVIALALGGRLSFNPLIDQLTAPDGKKFKLTAPGLAPEVPENGFVDIPSEYIPSSSPNGDVEVIIDPNSNRLQKLEPFPSWDGNDFVELLILAKLKQMHNRPYIARRTLVNISHLDKWRQSALNVNEFTTRKWTWKSQLNGNSESFPHIARDTNHYIKWIIIGDENYGEGGSRERKTPFI
jgi:aconitate hydratase